jgi:hypothetical protein
MVLVGLTLSILVGALIAACAVGRAAPSPVAVFFTNPDGSPCACILGVRPGMTMEEAQKVFMSHPQMKQAYWDYDAFVAPWGRVLPREDVNTRRFVQHIDLDFRPIFYRGQGTDATGRAYGEQSLGDLIAVLGDPTVTDVATTFPSGVAVKGPAVCPSVTYVSYHGVSLYVELLFPWGERCHLGNERIIHVVMSEPGMPQNAVPWLGFTSSERYVLAFRGKLRR